MKTMSVINLRLTNLREIEQKTSNTIDDVISEVSEGKDG